MNLSTTWIQMDNKSKDILIASLSGCGLQFAMHLLLASRQIGAVNSYISVSNDDLRRIQYPDNKQRWDAPRLQLDNYLTSKHVRGKKLFQMMNMSDLSSYGNTVKVVVYADIKTMSIMRLTKFSSIELFNESKISDFLSSGMALSDALASFQGSYSNIKADEWPDIKYPWELSNIPDEYVLELKEHGYNHTYGDLVVDYNGTEVFSGLMPLINNADIAVSLSDLLKTSGNILFEQLGITETEETRQFSQQYLSLHTEEQIKYLMET